MRALLAGSALFLSLVLSLTVIPASAQADAAPAVLSMEARAALRSEWLRLRMERLPVELMRREGVDMWIIISGEYGEDPVLRTMLPPTWLAARRTMMLVFHDDGASNSAERLAVARYPVTDLFPSAWDPEAQPDQWKRLAEIVAERDPKQIAINVAENFPLADGLSHGMHQQLVAALGPYAERLVSKPALAVGWLETRIPEEMAVYPHVVRLARSIIAEAFSDRVITPGATTADDVRWFMRDRIKALGLSTWFHPSVNIQRSGQDAFSITSMGLASANVIQPGDLLHVDFGITYLGLNTDTQHMAYVLRPGETQAPDGLRAGFAQANRVQDLLMAEFHAGRSGNEVLLAADAACAAEGLRQNIYSHPLGLHGHGAGPWIGGWDTDGAIPGRGDLLVYPNTGWSIELNATASVPEWDGQEVRFMTEEDAFFDGEQIRFMDGRQTELTLIGAPSL